MNNINELGKSKYFANRGIQRNKCRLPNLRIRVEIRKELLNPDDTETVERFSDKKFKDVGYISVL